MIRSNLCDYSDACIRTKASIIVPNKAPAAAAPVNSTNKKIIFKNCAPFTYYISEINNTQVDDPQDTDIVMPMYNLQEYSDTYSKTLGTLWQYYRQEPALDNNNYVTDFPNDNNNSISFKFKQQITGQTGNGGTKDVEIVVSLKYLSNFGGTLEMPLINCETNLQLKLSEKFILAAVTAANHVPEFKINYIKLYVPVLSLSTQDNVKLLKQLESGFKRTINWDKYQSEKNKSSAKQIFRFFN